MATQIHGAGPTGQRSPGLNLAIAGYLADNPPAGGGSSTTVQIGTVTLPESPTNGLSVSVLADSDTVLPEDVTWDSGGEPTITERMLLVFVWSGDDWVGTYGPSIPDVPEPADTTGPTAGTLGVVVDVTSADGTVTGAADETELHATPYSFRIDAGTWSAWQAGNTYEWTGLTAETEYDFQHRVRDAAGNITEGAVVTDTTEAPSADTTNPTPGTLSSSSITDTSFTLTVTGAADETALHSQPYAFSTDSGVTWTAWQTSASRNMTGLDPETEYTCQHKVRDAALNEATGASIPVETDSTSGGSGLSAAILALNPSVYLPFSETSGATVADASGNGHDATITGVEDTDYEWADGLEYLTATGRATIPHHVDLEPSASGLTLFAIVTNGTRIDKPIAVKGTGTTREYELSGAGATEGLYGGYRSGASWTSLAYAGGSGYSASATYAVAMTAPEPAPAAYPTFYIDNDTPLQSNTSGSASWVAREGDLRVGVDPHVVKAFAMFPYELTATQVGTLMAAAIVDGYIS